MTTKSLSLSTSIFHRVLRASIVLTILAAVLALVPPGTADAASQRPQRSQHESPNAKPTQHEKSQTLPPCTDANLIQQTVDQTAPVPGIIGSSGDYSSSYDPFQAFDGVENSLWISEVWEDPAWIGMSLPTLGTEVTAYEIVFHNPGLTSRAPHTWTLDGSNDGFNFTTVDSVQGQDNWQGYETRQFNVTNPDPFVVYRLTVEQDNDDRAQIAVISIAELNLYTNCEFASSVQCGDATAIVGGTAFSSPTYFGAYPAANAFDEIDSTLWISSVWNDPAWLGLDLATPTEVTGYEVSFNNPNLTTRAPRDWQLQGSNDGATWVTVDTQSGQTGWANTETRLFNLTTPAVFEQFRLHITADNDNRAPIVVISLDELCLFG